MRHGASSRPSASRRALGSVQGSEGVRASSALTPPRDIPFRQRRRSPLPQGIRGVGTSRQLRRHRRGKFWPRAREDVVVERSLALVTKGLPKRWPVSLGEEHTAGARHAALRAGGPGIYAGCGEELCEGRIGESVPCRVLRGLHVGAAHSRTQHAGEAVIVSFVAGAAPVEPRKADAIVREGERHLGQREIY